MKEIEMPQGSVFSKFNKRKTVNLKNLIPTYHKIEDQAYQYKYTVFTPVYNCEKTIARVHQSLINQSYKNFEWIVINDGSIDNSHKQINSIIKSSSLTINYINNIENQHKMGCFVQAISLAKGEFFLIIDGDDEILPNALEVLIDEYSNIADALKNKVSTVTALCQDQFGNIVGTSFPKSPFYSNSFKSHAIHGIKGDKWGFTKTSVLKGITVNNQILSKGLIPESLVWNLIAKEGYITKYINKVLHIYHVGVENSVSSLSVDKIAYGVSISSIARFNWFFNTYHFFKAPEYFLKNIYVLLRASKYLTYKITDYLNAINSKVVKLFVISLWPFRKLMN